MQHTRATPEPIVLHRHALTEFEIKEAKIENGERDQLHYDPPRTYGVEAEESKHLGYWFRQIQRACVPDYRNGQHQRHPHNPHRATDVEERITTT